MSDEPLQAAVEQAEQAAVQTQPETESERRKFGFFWGTGRRKTSVARVRIKPGEGKFDIDGRTIEKYFSEERDRQAVMAPLVVTEQTGKWDVFVNMHGGGFAGQAGAIALGLARALRAGNPDFEGVLREHNLLTRDARRVERKKYGRRGARRGFQFSKR